eukprot:6187618-Pleurochrysis_carterae.AAC.1
MPHVARIVPEPTRAVPVLLARFSGPQADHRMTPSNSTSTSQGTTAAPINLHVSVSQRECNFDLFLANANGVLER